MLSRYNGQHVHNLSLVCLHANIYQLAHKTQICVPKPKFRESQRIAKIIINHPEGGK